MNRALVIVAVIVFAIGCILVATQEAPDSRLVEGLLFGGLSAFAASFLPW